MLKEGQRIETTWNSANKKHYIEKGYEFTNLRDKFSVYIGDLPKSSKVMITVVCDFCKCNEYQMSYHAFNKSKSKEHFCDECDSIKNIIEVKCHTCNKVFKSTKTAKRKSKSGYLFCSNKCVGKYNAETKLNQIEKTCLICKKDYSVIPALAEKSVTCSTKCQKKWQSEYLVGENANNYKGGERVKKCQNCNGDFTCKSPYQYEHRKYCGLKCKHEFWTKNILHNESFRKNWFEGNAKSRERMAQGNETRPETMVREWLESKDIKFFQERGFMRKYYADFFLPSYKMIIEVMGDYWHGNPQVYGEGKTPLNDEQLIRIEKDKIKKQDFIKNGYLYIEIWESDIYENVDEIMNEICLKYIPVTTTRRTSKPSRPVDDDIV
jgi:G:T-mismatch repair DNA endonuclease (very short patch repair protein)